MKKRRRLKVSETLTCRTCGKQVKINNYGKKAKSGKKMGYGNNAAYTCSKCRGIIAPKKEKVLPNTGE
jgi:hypothetical protein